MRLSSRAALAIAAILFAAPALHAQTSFSIAAGVAVPMGDAADVYKMGYNATVGLGIKPPLAPLGIRIEGMFNAFDVKSVDENLRLMALTANGTYTMLPTVYLIGGVGMYNAKLSVAGVDASTDVGFNVGAGVNIPLTGFGTYLEARFHLVQGDGGNFQFVPITFGIKF